MNASGLSETAPVEDGGIATSQFRVGHGEFVRAMAARFGIRWIVLLAALVVAGGVAAAATADWRWAMASLMLALIVAPAAGAFLYFSYGLRRECYVNILPHSVIISPRGIDALVDRSVPDPEEDEQQPERPRHIESFGRHELGGYTVDPAGVTIAVGRPARGFLRLPYAAFTSVDDFRRAVEIMAAYREDGNQTSDKQ